MGAVAAVTAVTGALVVHYTSDEAPGGVRAADGVSGPVRTEADTLPVETGADGRSAALRREGVDPFSMVGVTWTEPSARVAGTVEVRTRAAGSGEWSRWLRLDGDSGQGDSGADRGGTEPAWVGPSDGVEVRIDGGRTAELPSGLRLDMVDPGDGSSAARVTAATGTRSATGDSAMEPAAFALDETPPSSVDEPPAADASTVEPPDTATSEPPVPGTDPEPTDIEPPAAEPPPTTEPATGGPEPTDEPPAPTSPTPTASSATPSATVVVPPAPPSTVPRPAITSRAQWGADESISPEEPGYLPDGRIKAVVVHHTAESNDYTCAQAPAVVRGVYAYHVKQLGWKDLGYNFVVDKCGTVYEGRKGGVDQPVMGAHAYGFNSETTGISVLGTYTSTAPSQAAMVSVARIAAWKLGQYGVSPTGTTTLTAGDGGRSYTGKSWARGGKLTVPTIHGHRDGYNTQCPGDAFYNQLATLRAWSGGPVAGLALKSVTGTGVSGTTHYTKASATVNWSATTPTALISRFEVLVDGKVAATTAGTATSKAVTLTAGTHSVAVRAVHQSGNSTTTSAVTVVAEKTAPTFPTKPNVALRTGTVNTAAVPLTLRWKATDNAALKEVRLTTPVAKTYGPTVTSAHHTAKSGTATKWSMTAHDRAGNTGTATVSAAPVILQESAGKKSGTWTTKSSGSYLGGRSYSSSAKNASLTWTFTGRSASWVVSRAATSGKADIYVDGKKAATVDLKSSSTKYRDAIWTKTWSGSARHTVKVVVLGTTGRPAVTTDGLVYLK